eukprot:5199133-Prymnesium_polylepis.1
MAKPTRVNVRSEPRGPKRTLPRSTPPWAQGQGVRESVEKHVKYGLNTKGRYSHVRPPIWVRVARPYFGKGVPEPSASPFTRHDNTSPARPRGSDVLHPDHAPPPGKTDTHFT